MTLEINPTPGVLLRPAEREDYAFSRQLYFETIGPLLKALGTWDEEAATARFEKAYLGQPSQIICVDGNDVGWLQISEDGTSVHLDQVHLVDRYRNRGVGSSLIRAIMARAGSNSLPVALNVIRGNRAIALYHRLGFRVVDEDEELFRMRWDPPPPNRT